MDGCPGETAITRIHSPVGQFHVGLLPSVLIIAPGQFLRDDQLGDVDSVAEQVRDGLLGIFHSPHWVPVDEDFLQAGVDQIGHQGAVVPTHGLNPLAVHFIMDVSFGEIQTSVPLLVDEKVREIHLK